MLGLLLDMGYTWHKDLWSSTTKLSVIDRKYPYKLWKVVVVNEQAKNISGGNGIYQLDFYDGLRYILNPSPQPPSITLTPEQVKKITL